MEPIGMAVAGLLMVALMWQNIFRLDIIILFLGVAAFCWIGIGILLSGKYREKVSHLLKNRLLTSSNIQLTVDEMEMLSREDKRTDDAVTKLYRLKLLGAQMPLDERNTTLVNLLKSNSEMILYESLSLVNEYPNEVFWPYLIELLNHPNDSVCRRASFVYCKHLQEESLEVMEDVIGDSEGRRLEYYISAVLKYSGLYGAIQYGRVLMDMIDAKNAAQRKSAARIVAMIGRADYYHPLTILINDPDKKVRKEAIIATSSVANERLLPLLIQRYRETDISRYSARAIEGFGPTAIPYISRELNKLHPREDLIRFVKLIGRIRGEESEKILFSIITHQDFEYRKESIYGLFRMGSKFTNWEKINFLEDLLKFELEIFELLKGQLFSKEGILEFYLGEAFKDEIRQLKSRVLRILGLIYDKHLIQKALDNLRNKDAFLRSNVLEMLETEIKMKHCKCVIPILEFKLSSVSLEGNKNEVESRKGIVNKILEKPMMGVSDWTLALLIRYYRENNLSIEKNDLKRLRDMKSDAVSQELNNQN
jgi:HEAT repeat protein